MFTAIGDWVATNRAGSNIVALLGLGDCTENGETVAEWAVATNALYRVENPTTTGLAQGAVYQVSLGNHDQAGIGAGPAGTSVQYNLAFGTNHFAGKSYYGGHYGNNNNNHYLLFSAGGMDFITVSLEYNDSDATGGTANSIVLTNVLAWADALFKTYSNRRGILVSHGMISENSYAVTNGNAAFFYQQGQTIFNALNNNTNLFLMLCGHHTPAPFAGRRYDTTNGHTIVTLMSDYQADTNGGSGFLRLYTFSPAKNQIQAQTFSPYFGSYKTDTNHQFTVPYNMASGSSFAPIGTNTGVASGSTSSRTWAGLSNGTKYEWYAVVSDGTNTVSGTTNNFTTALITQQPASVTNNVGSNVTFSVTAAVAPLKYQWYFGASALANATNSSVTLNNIQTTDGGAYSVAVTNNNGYQISAVATLTVNQLPVAGGDTLGARTNTAATVTDSKLLSNDSDPDGDPLTVTGVSATSTNGGTVTLSLGVVTYTPVAGYTGADRFTYILADGRGGNVNGIVSVTVTGSSGVSLNTTGIGFDNTGSNVLIKFVGIPTQLYFIQGSTNLVDWLLIGSNVAGSNGRFQFTDTNAYQFSQRYYRTLIP